MKHKWYKEIQAWAGDKTCIEANKAGTWFGTDYPQWDDLHYEFRIKPQPKQPKYLYAYIFNGTAMLTETKAGAANGARHIGKIEVQDD